MVDALRRAGLAEVDDSTLTRALYSSDASLYRVLPTAVVRPRDVDEVAATLDVCRRLGVPLTSRGAGTSIAGNAVGSGVVLDFSKHLNRVLAVDAEARTATVEPGLVQAQLQRAAAPHGLRFGPDPSTHNRATLGGMIGNNACGSRALGYGRTADNVLGLQLLTGTGQRLDLGADGAAAASEPLLAELRSVVGRDLATIRTELGRFSRQVSGYSLEHLLPERSFDVSRALVGTEGTLGVVLGASVRLVTEPARRGLVVLGYPDMATAADAVPALLVHRPTACEGIDGRILDVVRARRGPGAVPVMPRGGGWLLVEVTGQTSSEVAAMARAVVADAAALDAMVVTDARVAAGLWRIREDGAGLAGRTPAGAPAHSGWEDAAVPPAVLGAYLRDFERLLADYRLAGVPYGHFGDGCVHIRIDFPFESSSGVGVFRSFLTHAATLVAGYGGSLSGEHGDGRARSALLPLMYSGSALALFGRVKALFDPDNLLNPGVLVDPRPVDADLRVVQARPLREELALGYRHDGGDFSAAVHRCTGVGKCLADTSADGGVMCPSYLATREEKDSTRGRARALQEMVNGTTVTGGWRSPEVREALDLCLACKGCSSDCPTGVDMAAYKAEVLHQSYRGRLRPRSHYTLGWLPRWSRLASRAPRLANAVLGRPTVARVTRWAAGVDSRRGLPRFAEVTFHRWFSRRAGGVGSADRPPVLLFVDSFTEHFRPEVGIAAVQVLEDAGYAVRLTPSGLCCGLTWITTGQLDTAKRLVGQTVSALLPGVEAGVPVVGLEPSCAAVLRSDAVDLLGTAAAATVAGGTRTLAELLLDTPGWTPPDLTGTRAVAQPHCHHHAVMGWDTDARLLYAAGVEVERLGGCCGLAGNFGAERGHYAVSVAVAENALLPAIRDREPSAVVLADGFSCHTQMADLAAVDAVHLAQLLLPPPTPPSA
ncbi:MAG TPA: FAD-linked oxidase C-terminal domain-containing protein [Actinomycetes bacterium]